MGMEEVLRQGRSTVGEYAEVPESQYTQNVMVGEVIGRH